MVDIDIIDDKLYKAIYIDRDRIEFEKLWNEIKSNTVLLREAIRKCRDKFNQYDIVKGITICEQILYDYESVDLGVYQELINLVYSNTDIARLVINGASNGGYSYLLISLFNFKLKLTEEQKKFAVTEAMYKVGTSYWQKNQEIFSKKLDDMHLSDENTVYMDFGGSINAVGEKTGASYMNDVLVSLGREQAHGTGEYDIRYHILRNPNWTLDEKQQLIMDFWVCDQTYDDCLEQWEWGIVNDTANFGKNSVSPMDPYLLYKYTYDVLLRYYGDKDTTDRIWEEIQFCKQMHELRPQQNELKFDMFKKKLKKI